MHPPLQLNLQTLISVSALLTILTPYIAAIFTQDHLPQWVNELIAICVSVMSGLISFTVSGGSFNIHDLPGLWMSISGVLVGAKLYYTKLLPNSPLIKAIEYATGGSRSGNPVPAALLPAEFSGSQIDNLPTQATDSDADGTGG